MMEDLLYLWRHREKPVSWQRWIIVWGKRTRLFAEVLAQIIRPALFRAKGAHIGTLVVLGEARIDGCHGNFSIGAESALGKCTIALHDKVKIGRRAVINDGVHILTASHSLSDPEWRLKKAPVEIGDYAWVATNAVILPGVKIGLGSVVGAGAVVRNDVPDYAVVIGNPARIIDAHRAQDLSYSPVLLTAPFEAWVGRNRQKINQSSPTK